MPAAAGQSVTQSVAGVADFPAQELLVTTVRVQKVSLEWPYESGEVLVFDSNFFFFNLVHTKSGLPSGSTGKAYRENSRSWH